MNNNIKELDIFLSYRLGTNIEYLLDNTEIDYYYFTEDSFYRFIYKKETQKYEHRFTINNRKFYFDIEDKIFEEFDDIFVFFDIDKKKSINKLVYELVLDKKIKDEIYRLDIMDEIKLNDIIFSYIGSIDIKNFIEKNLYECEQNEVLSGGFVMEKKIENLIYNLVFKETNMYIRTHGTKNRRETFYINDENSEEINITGYIKDTKYLLLKKENKVIGVRGLLEYMLRKYSLVPLYIFNNKIK